MTMANAARESVTVELVADHPHLIPALGELGWREWGHAPEPVDLEWWIATTAREAGRAGLPVSWVAIDAAGEARRDRSPWVLGMIVRPDCRGAGIGQRLMAELERAARAWGYAQVWVATGGRAIDFYRKCGWIVSETIVRPAGESATILTKQL
jgi:GNAT superfamily N-acetyltransferase